MKSLFVSGDSFTDPGLVSTEHDYKISTCWPDELAVLLPGDWEVTNSAYRGHGNDYIAKTFFDHITKVGVPDLVVLMWSGGGRIFLSDSEVVENNRPGSKSGYHVDPIGYHGLATNPNPNKKNRANDTVLAEFCARYYDRFYPEQYTAFSIDNFLKNVFIVQQYCKSNNIPYIFSQAVDLIMFDDISHMVDACNYFINHHMESHIDESKFIGWPLFKAIDGYNMCDSIKGTSYAIGARDSHPNDYGHKLIGEKIFNKWKQLYG